MAFTFRLPDIGEGIHEGEIVKWFVKAGDQVKEDDILAEVQNDKAVVEIPSPVEGTVEEILVEEGTVAIVGDALIRFDAPGYEDLKLKGDDHHESNESNKTEAQVQSTAEAGQDVKKKKLKQIKVQILLSQKPLLKQKKLHRRLKQKLQANALSLCLLFASMLVKKVSKFSKFQVQAKMAVY